MEEVSRFAQEGGPVLGICNGFQVLCEAHMLPGALLHNASLRFVCRQVDVVVEHDRTAFTRACTPGEVLSLPIKHTTGCWFAPADQLDRARGERPGRAALRARPATPMARPRDVAGVSNEAGNVLGLMPHPEHAVDALTGLDRRPAAVHRALPRRGVSVAIEGGRRPVG